MLSGSVPFKHDSPFKQYFEAGLEPYVHYIPVKKDFSDLESQIMWAKNNDDKAQQIVKNAQTFAKNFFQKDQLNGYFIKVMQSYESIYNRDKDSNFVKSDYVTNIQKLHEGKQRKINHYV